MELWSRKTLKLFFVPGGFIVLGAWLVLETRWITISHSGVIFFYYAVVVAAALLSWRFHSKRIFFSLIVLVLAYQGIHYFALTGAGPGRVAFEAASLLLPLDFAFIAFFSERGDESKVLLWFLTLLFFESVFVGVAARPEQPAPAFLHYPFLRGYHTHLPQPAILAFAAALALVLVRFAQFHKATDSGMFWSLLATWMGLHAAATTKFGTAYFGGAALALASSIIENSYSLAYHDELTGL